MDVLAELSQFEPSGVEALALCCVVALALAGTIVGGFALLRRAEPNAPLHLTAAQRVPGEFSLVALWHLNRAAHGRARRHPDRTRDVGPCPAPATALNDPSSEPQAGRAAWGVLTTMAGIREYKRPRLHATGGAKTHP